MIEYTCPECHESMCSPSEHAGHPVVCEKCECRFLIPSPLIGELKTPTRSAAGVCPYCSGKMSLVAQPPSRFIGHVYEVLGMLTFLVSMTFLMGGKKYTFFGAMMGMSIGLMFVLIGCVRNIRSAAWMMGCEDCFFAAPMLSPTDVDNRGKNEEGVV